MKRTLLVGYSARGGNVEIDIELEEKEGKGPVLHMSGAVWEPPRRGSLKGERGRDIEGGGQNNEHIEHDIAELLIPTERLKRMLEVWERWHLNDLRAGCEHQRAGWDITEKLTVTEYTWSTAFHDQRRRAESGDLSTAEYDAYRVLSKRVHAVTIAIRRPKYETEEIKELLALGFIKVSKTEVKAAGWVNEIEHPRGLLSKPCEVCGYKYGNAWLYEPLPAEVVAEIKEWING